MLGRLFLYFNTLRHLRLRQFAYNFVRRLIKPSIPANYSVASNLLSFRLGIKYSNKIDSRSVCFLNDRVLLDEIYDWRCLHKPKLWRYNLHYFDYLLDDGADQQLKDGLINGWIQASSKLKEDAWEPYVLSLRIVNWIKYFIHYRNNQVPDSWLQSLHQQAVVLSRSVEYHILANHYLKNGKGLFFAGAYLKSEYSTGWYALGRKILLEEAVEQILPDGGHYEKSPMYHCILLEDYLDVVNLIKSNGLDMDKSDLLLLENKTHVALEFLRKILMPDGNIPLFNDSAFDIAPLPAEIFEYAYHVIGYAADNRVSERCVSLTDSGYYCIADTDSKLIIDCGSVSPDYQPGHTHCDMLSYELVIHGKRVIVDTGVHDYENSDTRRYSRATQAHNTVTIDDKEQSELWGQFRVARRARVHNAELTQHAAGGVFTGAYSPYWSSSSKITHKRMIDYSGNVWRVTDEVTGTDTDTDKHRVTSYIHLHPDLEVSHDGFYCHIRHAGVEIARIVFEKSYQVGFEEGWYYPAFGVKAKNVVITLTSEKTLLIVQKYSIEAVH